MRTQLCLAVAALAAHLPAVQWGPTGVVGWLVQRLGGEPQAVSLPCMLELLTVLPQVWPPASLPALLARPPAVVVQHCALHQDAAPAWPAASASAWPLLLLVWMHGAATCRVRWLPTCLRRCDHLGSNNAQGQYAASHRRALVHAHAPLLHPASTCMLPGGLQEASSYQPAVRPERRRQVVDEMMAYAPQVPACLYLCLTAGLALPRWLRSWQGTRPIRRLAGHMPDAACAGCSLAPPPPGRG